MAEIVGEDFGRQIANGMTVYDSAGSRIGTVQQIDRSTGWFSSEKGLLFPRGHYIPFSAIERIGPGGVHLSVTRDYVNDVLGHPPLVDVDVVAGPARATAVGTVPSGYDGSRVVLDGSTVSEAIARLDNGLKVYDANGTKVGRAYQYVEGSDWIMVEKALTFEDLYVPLTAITSMDGDSLYLRLPRGVLEDAFAVKPGTVTLDVTAGSAGATAVGTIRSEQDGSRILVDDSTISQTIARLDNGLEVYDSKGELVGRVHRYVAGSDWIAVENRLISPKSFYIPVTVIASLNCDGVRLRVAKDVLDKGFVAQPANAAFDGTGV